MSGQELESKMSDHPRVTLLEDSIEPLREFFNAEVYGRRFVALLSSTCPACVFGAKAIRESVLEAYPDAELSITIVWVDMLSADGEAAVTKAAEVFDDARVRQFYDETRRSSTAFATDVLYADGGPAWDIYLYYEPGAIWDEFPPKPAEWYHQLSGTKRGDPALFRPGQELVNQLRESTKAFVERCDRPGGLSEPAGP